MAHGPTRGPGRPRREALPALTREVIVDTALRLQREEGLQAVTMRRVAAELRTGPASLYAHVRNTADLHAQLLDALLVALPPDRPGPWRDRLTALLTAYADVLRERPEIARRAMFTRPGGPNSLALLDRVVGLLREGGASNRSAAWGVDLLVQFATVTAVEQAARASRTALGPDDARPPDGVDAAQLRWGLHVLAAGVVADGRP